MKWHPGFQSSHLVTVSHEGKVLVIGMDKTGGTRYTIRQDGFEDTYGSTETVGWADWKPLALPDESERDPSIVAEEAETLTYQEGERYLLRSRWDTARGAVAPLQVVSTKRYIVLFRQSPDGHLWVDRYVLDGINNRLVRKLDVRFKRSRQKYQPLTERRDGSTRDSLGYKDTEGNEFYEPTTELTLIDGVHDGWFDVVLAPTGEQEQHVWHFFVHRAEDNAIEITSLRMSEEGRFDVRDRLLPTDDGLVTQPGIVRQVVALDDLQVTHGPAAALYEVQTEGKTERGEPQLFRQGRRVMLIIPTDRGAVALSFVVGADGMLSRLQDEQPTEETLRAVQHDLLLPPETLEEIRAYGPLQEPERGTITGLSMDPESGRVLVSHEGGAIKHGQLVTIEGTRTYNHPYEVQDVEGLTFHVQDEGQKDGLGKWQAVSDEQPVKEGEITALRRGKEGLLEVVCRGHGLQAGQTVQIHDTHLYDGTFPVEVVDEHHFLLPIPWQAPEGVNVAQEAARRRGVRFDGEQDFMETPALPLTPLSAERPPARTYSAWIWPAPQEEAEGQRLQPLVISSDSVALTLEAGRLTGRVAFPGEADQPEALTVSASAPVTAQQWRHVALTVDYRPDADETVLTLFENGHKVGAATHAGRPHDPRSDEEAEVAIKLWVASLPPRGEPLRFAGAIAELRVWDVARSADELRDTLYLRLLGRERGLVGYWRMGAIGENNTVADFSVHNHDATLHGAPFVSAVTLPRTLAGGGGPVEALGYENDELVAVTRNARYEERFEYRTDTGEPIDLQLSVWGRRSRRSKDKISFDPVVQREQRELGDGWYEVSGSYTVPGEVSMLRIFGVERDVGPTDEPTWEALEIRRHRIRMLSDSVTERCYADVLAPEDALEADDDRLGLTLLSDDQAAARDELVTYGYLEAQEKGLIREKRYLERQLARLQDIEAARSQKEALDKKVQVLNTELAQIAGDIKSERDNPLNYWCKISWEDPALDGQILATQGHLVTTKRLGEAGPLGLWKFADLGKGRYRVHNKALGDGYSLLITRNSAQHPRPIYMYTSGGHADQWILLNRAGREAKRAHLTSEDYGTSYTLKGAQMVPRSTPQSRVILIPVEALETTRSKLDPLLQKEGTLKQRRSRLQQQRDELVEAINVAGGEDSGKKQRWEERLAQIEELLEEMRQQLKEQTASFLQAVQAANGATGQPLAPLFPEAATNGALLGFVQPRNRPTALATSDGMVQVSYVDARSRMRLTQFDAVYDSQNSVGEAWLPDGLRAALDVRDADAILHPKVEDSDGTPNSAPLVLNEDWTLEAWFYYPFPEGEVNWHTLAASQDGKHVLAMVDLRGRLGVWLDGFHESDFDMNTLPNGWHHITVVGTVAEKELEVPQKGEDDEEDMTPTYLPGASFYDITRFYGVSTEELQTLTMKDFYKWMKSARKEEKSEAQEGKTQEDKHSSQQRYPVTKFYIDGSLVGTVDAGRQATDIADLGGTAVPFEIEHEVHPDETLSQIAERTGTTVEAVVDRNDQVDDPNKSYAGKTLIIPAPGVLGYEVAETFGRITDVRVWNVALRDDEIAVNSRTLLTGNEPGLIAYYPMTEAEGDVVHDAAHRAGSQNLHTDQPVWVPSSAPIGHVGQRAAQFLESEDETPLTEDVGLDMGNPAHTLEAWLYIPIRPTARAWPLLLGQQSTGSHHWLIESDGTLVVGTWNGLQTRSHLLPGLWHHVATVYDGKTLRLYLNGEARGTVETEFDLSDGALYLGRRIYKKGQAPFRGRMAEVRVWDRALTPDELLERRYTRVSGNEPGLLGHWPLDREGAPGTNLPGVQLVEDRMLPLETTRETIVSAEYVTYGIQPVTGKKTAMMRRFFAILDEGELELLPEKRVEALDLIWVGNAQFEPTLLGYIEGPPPVPSENLTEEDDYTGATSVELARAEDVTYSWEREEETQHGFDLALFAGYAHEDSAGFGYHQKLTSMKIGFQGDVSGRWGSSSSSSVQASHSLGQIDRLEMRGTAERKPHFPHLGARFIPKNVGYALVVSGLADVFVTRLRRSGRMVSYTVRKVEDIPLDVNTITFLINPAYTMSGSLDGMTGTRATSDRYFRHVPEMRAQHGSLYPASYYRLREAYDLKEKIEKVDMDRKSYFENFKIRTSQGGMEYAIETDDVDAPTAITMDEGGDEGMTSEEKEKMREERAERARENAEAGEAELEEIAKRKREDIEARFSDSDAIVHAETTFESWQKKMERILLRAAKRNIVNTYVWDADGGLRTETQQFASAIEHTIGGSYELGFSLGMLMELEIFKAAVDLSAAYAFNITQTMAKSQGAEQTLELNVDLSGVESRGITDYDDYPLLPGEKVDRYRFMTFYLENSTDNFHDFFDYVVDPEWLASNDEEARALRQVQDGKPNKAWRVLHRVTYVERPALMGFGRSGLSADDGEASQLQKVQADIKSLRDANRRLTEQVEQIRRLLEQKLG